MSGNEMPSFDAQDFGSMFISRGKRDYIAAQARIGTHRMDVQRWHERVSGKRSPMTQNGGQDGLCISRSC
jgi:hypothetical protein